MKTVLPTCLILFAVAACGPLSMYYREGASVTRMQTDTTECQVAALKEVPVANQVRQSPPVYWPGQTYCDGRGRCYRSPGWWEPGRVYTVDANKALRDTVEAQCMARKGYRPVSLPLCKQSQKRGVAPQRTTTLPQLTGSACYVKFDDGSFQIITP